MSGKNEYKNIVLAGVWPTKNGHFNTMPLDSKAVEKLSKVAEVGGKFLIRKRSEDSIANSANPDRTPPYYIEFVPASEVQAFQDSRPKKHTNAL